MTNAPIRIVVLLGALTLVSMVAIQVYWSSRAIDSLEQQFSHNVKMSLRNVVESVCEINGTDVPLQNPIEQISSSYFIVRTNQPIQLSSLEQILVTEFENREIRESFEYGVYDCQRNQMIYGKLVSVEDEKEGPSLKTLPALEDYDYYFGVFFPNHRMSQLFGIDWLKFTTLISILILLFFAYAVFVLLRQKKLSAIQRDFINNIMHEFKTPVASIKMATEVLNQDKTAENKQRVKQYATLLDNECKRLESHVSQLLRSAETDHQKAPALIQISIPSLLEKVKAQTASLLEDKHLTLVTEPDYVAWGNEYLLETIFYNLIDNAVKYGGNEISVKVRATTKKIIITFYDNGNGFAKSESAKVFNKFYRISQGDQHSVKGFGLGLYVVKTMVKKMGGQIQLIDSTKAHYKLTLKKG